MVQQTGGSIGLEDGLVTAICREQNVAQEHATPDQIEQFIDAAKHRMLAVGFLSGVDKS